LRHSLATLATAEKWLEVCGNTGSSAVARRICEENLPGLIVLDMELPEGSGLGLLRDLARIRPDAGILALGEREDTAWLTRVFRAGARGYLSKQDETREISSALWRVAQGHRVVSRRISELVIGIVTSGQGMGAKRGVEALSPREIEVFSLLGKDQGPTAISRRLGVTVKTVETHCQHIKRKLGLLNGKALKQRALQWVLSAGGPAVSSAQFLFAVIMQCLTGNGESLGAI
jgi:DNA-binding NarL/FixJ family response regulator